MLIKEACLSLKLVQRPTIAQNAEIRNKTSTSHLAPHKPHYGRGGRKHIGVKGQGGLLGIILSRHDKAAAPMNSEQLWLLACIKMAQD